MGFQGIVVFKRYSNRVRVEIEGFDCTLLRKISGQFFPAVDNKIIIVRIVYAKLTGIEDNEFRTIYFYRFSILPHEVITPCPYFQFERDLRNWREVDGNIFDLFALGKKPHFKGRYPVQLIEKNVPFTEVTNLQLKRINNFAKKNPGLNLLDFTRNDIPVRILQSVFNSEFGGVSFYVKF